MLREYTPPPAPTEYLYYYLYYSTIQNSNILAAIASAYYNPEHHGKLKHVDRAAPLLHPRGGRGAPPLSASLSYAVTPTSPTSSRSRSGGSGSSSFVTSPSPHGSPKPQIPATPRNEDTREDTPKVHRRYTVEDTRHRLEDTQKRRPPDSVCIELPCRCNSPLASRSRRACSSSEP